MALSPRWTLEDDYTEGLRCAICGSRALKVRHLEQYPDFVSCDQCESAFIVEEEGNWVLYGSIGPDLPETRAFALRQWTWLDAVAQRAAEERSAAVEAPTDEPHIPEGPEEEVVDQPPKLAEPELREAPSRVYEEQPPVEEPGEGVVPEEDRAELQAEEEGWTPFEEIEPSPESIAEAGEPGDAPPLDAEGADPSQLFADFEEEEEPGEGEPFPWEEEGPARETPLRDVGAPVEDEPSEELYEGELPDFASEQPPEAEAPEPSFPPFEAEPSAEEEAPPEAAGPFEGELPDFASEQPPEAEAPEPSFPPFEAEPFAEEEAPPEAAGPFEGELPEFDAGEVTEEHAPPFSGHLSDLIEEEDQREAERLEGELPPSAIGASERGLEPPQPAEEIHEQPEEDQAVGEPIAGVRHRVIVEGETVKFPKNVCAHCLRSPVTLAASIRGSLPDPDNPEERKSVSFQLPLCRDCRRRAEANSPEERTARIQAHLVAALTALLAILLSLAVGLVDLSTQPLFGAVGLVLVAALGYTIPALILLGRASRFPPPRDAAIVLSTLRVSADAGEGRTAFEWRNQGYAELFRQVNRHNVSVTVEAVEDLTILPGEGLPSADEEAEADELAGLPEQVEESEPEGFPPELFPPEGN